MPSTRPQRYTDPLRATRTRAEVARLIGCANNSIDPMVEKKLLDAVTIGNRENITVASIERLLGAPIGVLEAPLLAADAKFAQTLKSFLNRIDPAIRDELLKAARASASDGPTAASVERLFGPAAQEPSKRRRKQPRPTATASAFTIP